MTILSQEQVTAICENGHTKGPWYVADGCSWRRIRSDWTSGKDDPVITPTNHRIDHHPDLDASQADLAIAAASPDLAETAKHLYEENARLREALEPFANPPAYVFNGDSKFVPANMPEDWIGGGWFATADFRKARQVLGADK